ncbi:MAG TPA: hypothetical protein ENN00_01925 [Bacillaceae bacterium]|nr:hypothetical protein [Bacillaceae bacterium]
MQPRFALYVFLATYFMAGFGFVPHLLLASPAGDGLALATGSLLGIVLALAYGALWCKAPYTPLHDQLTAVFPPLAARPLAAAFGLTYLMWGSFAILFSTDVAIRFLGAPAYFSLPVFLFAALAYVFFYLLPLSLLGPELLSGAPYPWLSAASAVRLYLSPMEQDFLTLVLVTLTSSSLAATVFWAASVRLFEAALFGNSAKRKGARGTTPELDAPAFMGMRRERLFPWLVLAVTGLFLLPIFWNLLGTEGTYREVAMFFDVLPAAELVALLVFGLFVRLPPQKRSPQGARRGFRGGKAVLVAILLSGSAAFVAGCNYRDIEQHAFVIGVGIDGPDVAESTSSTSW